MTISRFEELKNAIRVRLNEREYNSSMKHEALDHLEELYMLNLDEPEIAQEVAYWEDVLNIAIRELEANGHTFPLSELRLKEIAIKYRNEPVDDNEDLPF